MYKRPKSGRADICRLHKQMLGSELPVRHVQLQKYYFDLSVAGCGAGCGDAPLAELGATSVINCTASSSFDGLRWRRGGLLNEELCEGAVAGRVGTTGACPPL